MSITGQVGHVAIAKQVNGLKSDDAGGAKNVTAAEYRGVKITGDSLVAANNMLVAEGEIGTGRDVSQAVPGGFSSAGALNGNLRVRSASSFLHLGLGTKLQTAASGSGATAVAANDKYTPSDDIPYFTMEKKIGTTAPQLLILRYYDAQLNTLNITVPSGGLATFSAGVIAAAEEEVTTAPLFDPTAAGAYPVTSDELLVWHGGRIRHAVTGTTLVSPTHDDTTFQSVEFVLNNNIAADEYTIRPSRFLRSLTEGIRTVEANMTIVFENNLRYEAYTYGASGRTTPGYSLYMGALEVSLANWQLTGAQRAIWSDVATTAANPQGIEITVPKLAFTGLPVALASGRIAVSTTARALKDPTAPIMTAYVAPQSGLFATT